MNGYGLPCSSLGAPAVEHCTPQVGPLKKSAGKDGMEFRFRYNGRNNGYSANRVTKLFYPFLTVAYSS
jgi:hypothetical protein